ncbi:MAG: hypothetical protein RL328_2005 [Acidobacteriota bacterium]|jgi:3',5'-cyclic AMP phosphodiesterase CpdA
MKLKFAVWLAVCAMLAEAQVQAIRPPAAQLPAEADSSNITHFSFVVYGDTRGRQDGKAVQYEHSTLMDGMIANIRRLQSGNAPVKFVVQSGDAVVNGDRAEQWNVSFVPIIDRLTQTANVPYFFALGNHDVSNPGSGAQTAETAQRQPGLKNSLDALAKLIPPNGSPRRLRDYPTYSIAYGNTFVVFLDTNLVGDEKQFAWTKSQLAGLDRGRYQHVFVVTHYPVFSSGSHGGARVEIATTELRNRWMPLFREHHVEAVFSGHEHLFEHWVEYYTDASGEHRMDLVVSGGGGAPLYAYSQEPDLRAYLQSNAAAKVRVEHIAKPGAEPGSNPYHFLLVTVDGDRLDMEVIASDWGRGYQPYRSNRTAIGGGR